MFATDRDLLVLEPLLFRDLAWAGQTLVSGTATVVGSALEFDGDRALDLQGVGPGCVATVDGVSCEVVALVGATELLVSVPRAAPGDPPAAPPPAVSRPAYIATFRPQLAWAHRAVLHMAGVAPAGEGAPGQPEEGAIRNGEDLRRLEALVAAGLIYATVAAGGPADAPHAQRAALYARRAAAERARLRVHLDRDGDGVADEVRALGAPRMTRG